MLALWIGLGLAAASGAKARDPSWAKAGALPEPGFVEMTHGAEPLRPTADAIPGPPPVTPSVMEYPNGSAFDAFLDIPHAFIERRVFDMSNGFDLFFADERDLAVRRPHSFIRWRNEIRVSETGALAFGTDLRADISLPSIEHRLKAFRLVLEDAGRGLTDTKPRAITGQAADGRGDALLRWTLLDSLRSSLDLGGGIIFGWPPGAVGKLRFRFARELGPIALARVATSAFWDSRVGFGYNASLALERPIIPRLLLRWTLGTLLTQSSNGYETGSEVSLLATLGRSTALSLVASASAEAKPVAVVRTMRVGSRFRTAVVRRWIFGEVEPSVSWPLEPTYASPTWLRPTQGRHAVPMVTFRLEIQFEETPPPKAPAKGSAPAH